jgi:WD40 repeat protein
MGGPSHTGDENAIAAGNGGGGWVASGGLDRCVKIWDLSILDSTFPHRPTYTIHPAFPVRRVHWRPDYGCELAIISNAEFSAGPNQDLTAEGIERTGRDSVANTNLACSSVGDAVEIWDVRRAWIAKWKVSDVSESVLGGCVTGVYLLRNTCVCTHTCTA